MMYVLCRVRELDWAVIVGCGFEVGSSGAGGVSSYSEKTLWGGEGC